MSSLLESFREMFPDGARRQGDEYVREGGVREVSVDRAGVRGRIGGVDQGGHRAEIGFGGGEDGIDCSCPAFVEQGPCEHLWALLRVIDQGGSSVQVREASEARTEVGRALGEAWRERLENLRSGGGARTVAPSPAARRHELRYAIDLAQSGASSGLVFHSLIVSRGANEEWGEPEPWVPWVRGSQRQMNPADHAIFSIIRGAEEEVLRRGGMGLHGLGGLAAEGGSVFHLGVELTEVLAPKIARTGRLYAIGASDEPIGPLMEDAGAPWRFQVQITRDEHEAVLSGELVRPARDAADRTERMPAEEPLAVLGGGWLVLRDRLARFEGAAGSTVLAELRESGALRVPAEHEGMLVQSLLSDPTLEPDDVTGLDVRSDVEPTPHLYVEPPSDGGHGRRRQGARLACRVSFLYGGASVDADAPERGVVLASRVPVLRDLEREQAHLDRLFELGVEPPEPAELGEAPEALAAAQRTASHGMVSASRLRDLVPDLLAEGWSVEAEGRRWRTAVYTSARVRSGIDWFELEGGAHFGTETVSLPRLLAAVRSGTRSVQLGDGSVGVLPEKWLAQWNLLDLAAETSGNALRFTSSQGMLLDALLAARDDVDVDERFREARERWRNFREPTPQDAPEGFRTELRPYQRDGLGWLNALRDLRLGGCLADDMGLGKTVQVLALLEQLRVQRAADGSSEQLPSLVVAPRSLVFNWIAEAKRFAPELSVLDYTGPGRKGLLGEFDRTDVVVTTYGTLRRDAEKLSERRFDVCVLDEAQAIKNAASQVAKASRLVRANQRLALSGTPIENNVGELWSLMEYLEPGLLGRSHAFRRFLKNGGTGREEDLSALSRAIAPFFLRRTKEAVCADLPEKTELVLSCRLGRSARREYDELREHYRRSLLAELDEHGMDGVRMHVLEGLLRLRQAACHPGLIDPARRGEDSAKLEMLMPMVEELVAEGHKALVFSQFTSFLAVVRERLEQRDLPYAYLDGQTRKREAQIRRFQEDPDCPLFLVSLKAGGAGLNLTAADYVFLLDPWWNPATEAQAIDRAHRIGRTRPVIAYRLITADTVEERVRELQDRKRALTDALFSESASGLAGLTREDLEALFGGDGGGGSGA